MTSEAAGAIVVLEVVVAVVALATGIPAVVVAVVAVAGVAASGKLTIEDCRLTIFGMKSSVAVKALAECQGGSLSTSIVNRNALPANCRDSVVD